jgi:hypothetical protein
MRTDTGDAGSLRHMCCGTHRHAHGWKRLHDVCEGMATAAGTVPSFWSHFMTSLCVIFGHILPPCTPPLPITPLLRKGRYEPLYSSMYDD